MRRRFSCVQLFYFPFVVGTVHVFLNVFCIVQCVLQHAVRVGPLPERQLAKRGLVNLGVPTFGHFQEDSGPTAKGVKQFSPQAVQLLLVLVVDAKHTLGRVVFVLNRDAATLGIVAAEPIHQANADAARAVNDWAQHSLRPFPRNLQIVQCLGLLLGPHR